MFLMLCGINSYISGNKKGKVDILEEQHSEGDSKESTWCPYYENALKYLSDHGLGNDFLNTPIKVWSMKNKIDKSNLIKSKNFCFAKWL